MWIGSSESHLRALKLPAVASKEMQQIAKQMADKEISMLYSSSAQNMELDLQADPQGNYAVDTLIHTLKEKSSQTVERWMPGAPIKGSILLIGSGQHWQAALKDKENLWYLCEKHSAKAIQNLSSLLTGRTKHGAVYLVGEHDQLPDSSYIQKFFSRIEKKCKQ